MDLAFQDLDTMEFQIFPLTNPSRSVYSHNPTPEHQLLAAILFRVALDLKEIPLLRFNSLPRDFAETIRQNINRKKANRSEALHYLLSNSLEPFSFFWICYQLDLDPLFLRKLLQNKDFISNLKS